MQSAGLRTRGRASLAPSIDDTASIVTLHTIPDSTLSPASKSRRTTFANPSRSQLPSTNPPSSNPSAAPSLIIQKHDPLSRPSTTTSRSKSSGRGRAPKPKVKKPALPEQKPKAELGSDSDYEDSLDDDFDEPDVTPPLFTIDLSKAPSERYNHVAQHFTPHRVILEKLFREIAKETFKSWDTESVRKWGRRIFRKLPSAEEEEELQGIANVWGVEKYLLVAFNVLLDSFMGCTSGGVRVRDPPAKANRQKDDTNGGLDTASARGRMLHFRTLDWGMDMLRKLVCQYEYVEQSGGPVVARQVTYFGFVGVLTGLRKGLSISLNFRPCHDATSWWQKLCFRSHQIMVLLGWRQSITSLLRECLLPCKYHPLRTLPNLVDIERDMPTKKTTAAYLIFSDGSRTTTMEKDHHNAVLRSASDFIVALNHDAGDNGQPPAENTLEIVETDPEQARLPHDMLSSTGMEGLVAASQDRKRCVTEHWKATKARRKGPAVQTEDVVKWMQDPDICNDETHYGIIMDPSRGEIVWLRRWLRPLELDDPR